MAKQISQETFDDAVRENMAEFDMAVEEALQDAIEQFESQGVNLSIIVKDASLYANAEGEVQQHPVVSLIETLDKALNDVPINNSVVTEALISLRDECDIDLARRCLAGKHGAYIVLLKAMNAFKDLPENLRIALTAFCSLSDGQPDLLENEGVELLISFLQICENNVETLELAIKAIRLNCIKHEGNRQAFIQLDLIIKLTNLLTKFKSKASLIKEICICLRTLTLDDDVRVPFGKAHENAKAIVTEGDALNAILQICEEHENDTSVLAEMFQALSCLVVRNEFCKEVMDRGGVRLIVKAFQCSIKDKLIVRQALIVLKSLAGNDEVKSEISKLGGIELVVTAMTTHQSNAKVAEAACKVLTAITLRNSENCRLVIECQGHQHIIQAMKIHSADVGVQKNACMAIRNLVSRDKEYCDMIVSLGVEPLLNLAMNTHKDAYDEAKAALRDLGCKVELTELWKGERGTLNQD